MKSLIFLLALGLVQYSLQDGTCPAGGSCYQALSSNGEEPIEFDVPLTACPTILLTEILAEVNALRAKHGAKALLHSNNLALQSQDYIRKIPMVTDSVRDQHLHSGNTLVFMQSLEPDADQGAVSPQNVLDVWLMNSVYKNYSYFGSEPPKAHVQDTWAFTTMIWASSSIVGLGCATKQNPGEDAATLYVVAKFNPSGNQYCDFKYNVLPPRDSKLYEKLMNEPQVPEKFCNAEATLPNMPIAFDVPTKQCEAQFKKNLLDDINNFRTAHGTPLLEASPEIEAYSQKYANEIAVKDGLKPQGNNTYKKALIYKAFYKGTYKALALSAQNTSLYWKGDWVNGGTTTEFNYQQFYGQEPNMDLLGHYETFTQLLWYSSKKIGIGCATANVNGTTLIYVVANVDPPGNKKCDFKYNVLPHYHTALYDMLKKDIDDGTQVPDPVCVVKPVKDYYFKTGCYSTCPVGFREDLLKKINNLRDAHGVKPLAYRQGIADYTQVWAQYLAARSGTDHQPSNYFGSDVIYTNSVASNFARYPVKPHEPYRFWNKQASKYTYYNSEPPMEKLAEFDVFAQFIWKDTTHIGFGCGLAYDQLTNRTSYSVVVNFEPYGNRKCGYKQNVLPNSKSALHQEMLKSPILPDPTCIPDPLKVVTKAPILTTKSHRGTVFPITSEPLVESETTTEPEIRIERTSESTFRLKNPVKHHHLFG